MATATTYSGPIPPPEALERFNQIIPKGAHRILRMAEKQQQHRHTLESKVVISDIRRSWGGLIAGFLLTILAVGLGVWLIHKDHDAAGTTVATGPIIGLVYTFVIGVSQRQRERAAKMQAVAPK